MARSTPFRTDVEGSGQMRQIHDTNLVFIHIPKTAGMAVVSAFGLEHRSTDHMMSREEDRAFLGSEYVRFLVFRDPLARLVSAYKYSLSMLHNHHGNTVREDILNHGLDKDVNAFLAHYADQPARLLKNLHFVPQWFYYVNGKPSIVLRQEHLATDIQIIAGLAPQHFEGLSVRNKSASQLEANTALTDESKARVKDLYRTDFLLWGGSALGS